MSGWINTDKNGKKYLGLEVKRPQSKRKVDTPPQPPKEDEDLPF